MSTRRSNHRRMLLTAAVVGLSVVLAVILIVGCFITADRSVPPDTEPSTTETPTTEATTLSTETTVPIPSTVETTPPTTVPPETEPPIETTQPRQPPATTPPSTTPPTTEPAPPPTAPPPTTAPPEETIPVTYERFSLFSGQYVEDGRDELVENVAAILVTNVSVAYLDLATLTFDLDGKTATFMVTGLPAGQSAWVMEQNRMTATHSSTLTYLDCVSAVRQDAVSSTPDISITADGSILTAHNNTGETLKDVCVYYKVKHTDGNFFGGITYLVSFGDLEPGASSQSLAGHYSEENTEIVRIGWTK